MKGIVLAGGAGSRLHPLTKVCCKQLLPVYNKPMIHYPLATLMSAGITDILIISTNKDTPILQAYIGNGKEYGLNIEYKSQNRPDGIAQAFILGEDFIGNDDVCLILGDNLFFLNNIELDNIAENYVNAVIFTYVVGDPERYGVVEIDDYGFVTSIEEKPKNPKSNLAVPGLYFFDNTVIDKAKRCIPSSRGELEITDVIRMYADEHKLRAHNLGLGSAWLDMGTHDNLLEAANFVKIIETRQGIKIADLDQIAKDREYI